MNLENIKRLFNTVKIPNEFGGNSENEDYYWVFEWLDENIIPQLEGQYEIAHGVSKIVLVPNEGDYVIKIPFNGCYETIWDEEEDEEVESEEIWREFYNAPENCGWDYCAAEVEVYERAVELGVECFFAKTEFLCFTNNWYPIYIQEKVKTRYAFAKELIQPSEKSLKDYDEKYKKGFGDCGVLRDNNWVALSIDKYGIEIVKKFVDFLHYDMPFINCDMHSENYGFRLDKTPCLIDFSDWCEND